MVLNLKGTFKKNVLQSCFHRVAIPYRDCFQRKNLTMTKKVIIFNQCQISIFVLNFK